jgi:hypothetical protein
MMDMANHGAALCEAARVLRAGGFLQFSILHPCFVPPYRRVLREPNGTTGAIEIGGYFDATDGRIDTFRFENAPREERDKTEPFRVPRFHRTLSGWVSLIVEAGLVIERFGEPPRQRRSGQGETRVGRHAGRADLSAYPSAQAGRPGERCA